MIEIKVYGSPASQGSKRYVGNGIMIESSKTLRPWRQAVTYAAIEAMGGAGAQKIIGPVWAQITFTVQKPKSASKSRRTYPDRRPDLDKLLRAAFDSLTDAGCWEEDSRVISLSAAKVFPNDGVNSLPVPGVLIRVRSALGIS